MKILRTRVNFFAAALLLLAPAVGLSQVAFYGVGDLPGGITQSEVRDATRAGSVLYAVGGSAANVGSVGNDTAFLWTSTGGITGLPPLVPGVVDSSNAVIGSAITPDAAYIAARARFNPIATGQRHAVRVTTSGLAEIDLGALPTFPQQSIANAISNDGSVLYGFAKYSASGQTQAVRYTVAGPTVTAIPFLNAGDNVSSPAGRGSSSDGSVMVGTSTNSGVDGGDFYGPGNGAYRFVQGSGVTAIPYRPGGTWNIAVAVSPNGNLVMVIGDSPAAPNGEIYLYDATSLAQTSLGTPVAGWWANILAGMTPDGSLAVIGLGDPDGAVQASFLHNAAGWHEIHAIVAGAGVNLTGWTLDSVVGISSDGTRIWGSGVHNGNREGFIAEFPARYLATYAASPPAQSIVGSYSGSDNTTEGASVLVFLANGTYYQIQDAKVSELPTGFDGYERGTYTWDPVTHAFTATTLVDTNGDTGLSGISGVAGLVLSSSNNIGTLDGTAIGAGAYSAPLVTGASPIVGTWVIGDTTVPDNSAIVTFFANGTYLQAYDGPADVSHPKGMERGTYTWDSVSGAFSATALVDTNGTAGLSDPTGSVTVTVTGDALTYTNLSGPGTANRVIAAPQAPSVAVMMTERTHAAAGPFDHVLSAVPTNPITEPRVGPNHTVIFTFDKPVTAATATVTEGVATAGAPTFSGNQVTVPLTGVSDKQYVTVSLTNVTAADGGTGGSGSGRIGFLTGDVNGSRLLAVTDLVVVNNQLGKPLTAANFLSDVNASGIITVLDKVVVNNNLGHFLPAP